MRIPVAALEGVVEHEIDGETVRIVFPLVGNERVPERTAARVIDGDMDLYPLRSSSHKRLAALLA